MAKETLGEQEFDFWDSLESILKNNSSHPTKTVEHFVESLKKQAEFVKDHPEMFPEGDAQVKRLALRLVTGALDLNTHFKEKNEV